MHGSSTPNPKTPGTLSINEKRDRKSGANQAARKAARLALRNRDDD